MPVTVLIAGFGPFPGAPFNPTQALANALARRRRPALDEVVRVAHGFRTSYAAVDRELPALIARHRPDVVLLFGLAQRTPYLRIEARARNRRSTLFADVDGTHPSPAIRPGEASALIGNASHSTLRIAARNARVPVRISIDAGRYLCNFSYWRALELARREGALVQFVHVPHVARARAGVRRRKPGRARLLTRADLMRAGEAILLTLLQAARAARGRANRSASAPSDAVAGRAERRIAAVG